VRRGVERNASPKVRERELERREKTQKFAFKWKIAIITGGDDCSFRRIFLLSFFLYSGSTPVVVIITRFLSVGVEILEALLVRIQYTHRPTQVEAASLAVTAVATRGVAAAAGDAVAFHGRAALVRRRFRR